jgi:NAD kinase
MGLRIDQKIVIVTRPTQLASLRRKFNTRSQAKFQMVSAKQRELAQAKTKTRNIEMLAEAAFAEVEKAADEYDAAVERLQHEVKFPDFDIPVQTIDRDFLPNFLFGPKDIVVTVGQDGLVANTAKYAIGLPIVAVNPDPARIDGILLPFSPEQARAAVRSVLQGKAAYRQVTLAEASLPDGQRLLAFNELFIGNRTHVSARYQLSVAGHTEPQSSSGVIVCTGAGSTGWLSSIFNMAAAVSGMFGPTKGKQAMRLDWEDPRLFYVVREPFLSKSSRASVVSGLLPPGQEIVIESEMASNGVIFSDGVESDALEFNAGVVARVHTAEKKALLVIKP